MPGTALVTINGNQWSVNIANTSIELTAGLAGVVSIPAGTGMLFILPVSQVVTVNTNEMLFPLDIIFISGGLVIDITRNIQPGYLVTEETPCDMFLEVNANEAVGIDVGDTITTTTIQEPGNNFSQIISLALPLLILGFVFGIFKPLISSKKSGKIASNIPERGKAVLSPKLELIYPEKKREIPEEIEYFPDSSEFLTQTIIDIGWKEKIETAFRDRMIKVRNN